MMLSRSRYLLCLAWVCVYAALASSESIELSIDPDSLGQELKHGVDAKLSLKDWADSPQAEALCQRLFADEPFSVFRIPIYAMRSIDDPFYRKVIELARIARAANPDLILFASVANGDGDLNNNLHNKHKFPLSMRCGDEEKGCDNGRIYNLDLDAYANYLDDFLVMMREEGVSIDWIGPWNEDNASVRDVAYLWRRMKEEKGLIRVGLETWALARGIEKIQRLQPKLDLVGSHFYDDEQGKAIPKHLWDERWSQLVDRSRKPVWFTEATDYKEAEIDEARFLVKALERLIVAANAGVEGIIYYQTVPRIVGYENKPVPLKHSGLINFIRKTSASARIASPVLENPNTRLLAHFDGRKRKLGVHLTNSDRVPRRISLALSESHYLEKIEIARIWSERSMGESMSLSSLADSELSLELPATSYVYVELKTRSDSP